MEAGTRKTDTEREAHSQDAGTKKDVIEEVH